MLVTRLGYMLHCKGIPPEPEKKAYQLIIKTRLNELCRVAAVDRIGRNIPGYYRISGNDRSITDFYTRHNDALTTDPYIIPDNRVSLMRKLFHVRRRIFCPRCHPAGVHAPL